MQNRLSKVLGVMALLLFATSIAYCEGTIVQPIDGNTVEFTCADFAEKAKNCEEYTCQVPYNQDPTVKTEWKILGKNNNRCIISQTTDNVGMKDENGNPMPITKTCDYDEIGIESLNSLFENMQDHYYPSLSTTHEGTYDCKITSNGHSVKPEPYVVPNNDE